MRGGRHDAGCVIVVAAFQSPAVVAGLDDVAMVGQTVEQRLGVAEYAWSFADGEIGGDNDGRALVEPADEVEQELAAGLSEWQVTEFVEDDEVHPGQMLGDTTLSSIADLDLEAIDEVNHVVEATAGAGAAASGDCDGQMSLAGAGTRTALRCWAMKPPPARSLMSVWLIGVPSNWKSASFSKEACLNL